MSIYALANLIARLFNVYEFMIVVWCIMSWVPRGIGHGGIDSFRDALGTLVEPYLGFFMRLMPRACWGGLFADSGDIRARHHRASGFVYHFVVLGRGTPAFIDPKGNQNGNHTSRHRAADLLSLQARL